MYLYFVVCFCFKIRVPEAGQEDFGNSERFMLKNYSLSDGTTETHSSVSVVASEHCEDDVHIDVSPFKNSYESHRFCMSRIVLCFEKLVNTEFSEISIDKSGR